MRVAQAAVLAVVEAKLVLAAVEAKVAAGLAVVEANMVAAEMVREATVLEAAAVTALEMWAPEKEVRAAEEEKARAVKAKEGVMSIRGPRWRPAARRLWS